MIDMQLLLPYVYATLGIFLLWWRSRVERARNTATIEAKAQALIQEQFKAQQKQIADLQSKLDKAEADLSATRQEAVIDRAHSESEIARLTLQVSDQKAQLDEYKREREALAKDLAKKQEREGALSEELANARALIRDQGTRLAQQEGAAQVYRDLLALHFKPPAAVVEAPAN